MDERQRRSGPGGWRRGEVAWRPLRAKDGAGGGGRRRGEVAWRHGRAKDGAGPGGRRRGEVGWRHVRAKDGGPVPVGAVADSIRRMSSWQGLGGRGRRGDDDATRGTDGDVAAGATPPAEDAPDGRGRVDARLPEPAPVAQPAALRVEPFRLIEEAERGGRAASGTTRSGRRQRILAAARAAQDQETARIRRQAEREAASFRADAMAAAAKLTATAKTEADRVRAPGPGRRRQHPRGGVGRLTRRGAASLQGGRRGRAGPGRRPKPRPRPTRLRDRRPRPRPSRLRADAQVQTPPRSSTRRGPPSRSGRRASGPTREAERARSPRRRPQAGGRRPRTAPRRRRRRRRRRSRPG